MAIFPRIIPLYGVLPHSLIKAGLFVDYVWTCVPMDCLRLIGWTTCPTPPTINITCRNFLKQHMLQASRFKPQFSANGPVQLKLFQVYNHNILYMSKYNPSLFLLSGSLVRRLMSPPLHTFILAIPQCRTKSDECHFFP